MHVDKCWVQSVAGRSLSRRSGSLADSMPCGIANCLHTATATARTRGACTHHSQWQVGRQHAMWKCKLFAYSYSYSMDRRCFVYYSEHLCCKITPAACVFEKQKLLQNQLYSTDRFRLAPTTAAERMYLYSDPTLYKLREVNFNTFFSYATYQQGAAGFAENSVSACVRQNMVSQNTTHH